MIMELTAYTLSAVLNRVGHIVNNCPDLVNVWIVAQTSDLRVNARSGHCYMDLIEKDAVGRIVAQCRGNLWASDYYRVNAEFQKATGSSLGSDMKILIKGSVRFSTQYGFAITITDVDPRYTLGDIARRRQEILMRLSNEGIVDANKSLEMPPLPTRVAVISALGAAGFGDFMKQLHLNPRRIRFSTTLFTAVMQGEQTAPSIIAALDAISERIDDFDCVVIVRGGGATTDLTSFDDYSLAANVALFPLPIVVGIGHDRDQTVLDYIAHTRVKTPTAAAEFLVSSAENSFARLLDLGRQIHEFTQKKLHSEDRKLAQLRGMLPSMIANIIAEHRRRTGAEAVQALASGVRQQIATARTLVGPHTQELLQQSTQSLISLRKSRLDALSEVLETLSPEATLRRGYTITRIDGRAVTNPKDIPAGAEISTTFAGGCVRTSILNADNEN